RTFLSSFTTLVRFDSETNVLGQSAVRIWDLDCARGRLRSSSSSRSNALGPTATASGPRQSWRLPKSAVNSPNSTVTPLPRATRNDPGSCRGLPDLRHRPSVKQGLALGQATPLKGVAHEGVDRDGFARPRRARARSGAAVVPGAAAAEPRRLRRR